MRKFIYSYLAVFALAGLPALANDLSFTGTITEVVSAIHLPPVSEHDALWKKAKVTGSSQIVEIWFASSRDVMWYRAPKLTVGEHAAFVAHENQGDISNLPLHAYYVLDPADVVVQ